MERTFKMLLVDDDTDTRSLYAEVFQAAGFEVREAKDGLEGLEMATSDRPDVVFTGIIMPRMDGFALTEALRSNVVTSSIPIAFSSHLGRQEDQQRAKELGVDEFIVRDVVTPNEAVARIQSLVSHSEYMIAFDIRALDAQKLAADLRLNPNFLCSENGGRQFALRLKVKNTSTRTFEAEFVCIP
ncbi:MAG: response regulator [Candidatus Moraniibacteriota bacterium]|nr:MAG: response regulator [Candidatus Moranbacteria bacterium]